MKFTRRKHQELLLIIMPYFNGIYFQYMLNQYQTKTFPNHWTMVTGLYEESHGIVANEFYDPATDSHFMYTDPKSWNATPQFWGGEPLWITNQKQGHKSGCEFWVGSEVKDRTPTHFGKYNDSKVSTTKIKVLFIVVVRYQLALVIFSDLQNRENYTRDA